MHILFNMILIVPGDDYLPFEDDFTFTAKGQYKYVTIQILNNAKHDGKRYFFLYIKSSCGVYIWIQIFIWDDEWGRFNKD